MKTILITGATGELGRECAVQLGARGHHICLVDRTPASLYVAGERVRAAGAATVDTLACNFESLTAVESLAQQVRERYSQLDVLITNTGALYPVRTQTEDGNEATFAVNHLAPYLLTERLKPVLVSSVPSRIIITVSSGHERATMDFDDLQYTRRYSGFKAYHRSKLANVLYARYLAEELADSGVTVNTIDPGTIGADTWDETSRLAASLEVVTKMTQSAAQGAAHITTLAVDPDLSIITGRYFDRDRTVTPLTPGQDDALAIKLRNISDRLVGNATAVRPSSYSATELASPPCRVPPVSRVEFV